MKRENEILTQKEARKSICLLKFNTCCSRRPKSWKQAAGLSRGQGAVLVHALQPQQLTSSIWDYCIQGHCCWASGNLKALDILYKEIKIECNVLFVLRKKSELE